MTREQLSVLYVDNSYTFGGAINALEHLLSATEGIRPIVLSAQPEAALREQFPDIETHHWAVRLSWVHDGRHRQVPGLLRRGPLRYVWSKLRALGWIAFVDVPETVRMVRFVKRHGVQLVHLNNGVDGMLPVLLAARVLRLPLVAHARGPVSTQGIARHYAKSADRWIAVSGTMKRNVVEAGVDESRITVIHDAIDLTRFERRPAPAGLKESLGIPSTASVFGIFARIVDWKGIREFVQAARLVIESVPESYALVVGDASDGSEEYYASVIRLAKELGVDERVIFTGFRRDVADVMRLCDVVVHSSIVPEPFGMTVIEAMATGAAVVAANAGGPTEIIPSEDYGVLVDPTDAEQLAGSITKLLRDSRTAIEMGLRASDRVRERFSAERYAHEVQAVYRDILHSEERERSMNYGDAPSLNSAD